MENGGYNVIVQYSTLSTDSVDGHDSRLIAIDSADGYAHKRVLVLLGVV